MSIRSLLVPVDYQEPSDRALEVAGGLALAADLPIEVLTVSSPGLADSRDEPELARRLRSVAPARGSAVLLHDDDVAGAIVGALEDRPYALPVLGTAAHGPVGELLLGSVTECVLARLDRPSLLVGPAARVPARLPARVIVAVESWHGAEHLLDAVTSWTEAFGGSVEVVEALPAERTGAPTELVEAALVRGVASALRRRGVSAQWETPHGNPADVVVDLAAPSPAVVAVSSTRWTEGRRVHWHSIAREVVRRSSAPVLLVPAGRSADRY